jgi:hypothetical protein
MSLSSSPLPPALRENMVRVGDLYRALTTTLPGVAGYANEDEEHLSVRLVPASAAEATGWLAALSPHADLADIRLSYTLAEGLRGALTLRTGRSTIVTQPCERLELYRQPEDLALRHSLDALETALSRRGAPLPLQRLEADLALLERGGVGVALVLRASVNKQALAGKLGWQGLPANLLVFFFPCTFRALLAGKSVAALEEGWLVEPERPLAIVLLGSQGSLEGEFVGCFGLDAVDRVEGFLARPRDAERVRDIRALCDEQCNWEDRPDVLTPDHLWLEDRGFGGDCAGQIQAEFRALAAQLAVAYLANRTDLDADPPQSRFDGYRICRVPASRAAWQALIRDEGRDPAPLLALYRWAYENASGDQLGVLRQLVSLELEEGPGGNAEQLLDKSGRLLRTARVSFQQLVRRNIGQYFVARNQVVDFLREYTDQIGSTLSDLTGELVANLYKTLAAIIAAIIAAELTQEPAVVVLVSAVLYAVYIILIVAYLMPSVWSRFHLKRQEYQNNVQQFVQKDVLLKEEIERFQGIAYRASEKLFYRYFWITLAIYAALAAAAVAVAIIYGLQP